jgi:hypothetical protein
MLSGLALAGALSIRSVRPVPGGKAFPSAEAAAWALASAAASDDLNGLLEILGPSAQNIMSGNSAADRRIRHDFAANAARRMKLVAYRGRPDECMLLTGKKEWRLPIPIVKVSDSWYFATGQSWHQE